MRLRSVSAVVLAVVVIASSAALAGPAQDVLSDLARSERSARLATGYTTIGLGVAIGAVSTVVLVDSGIGIYGVLTGALIAIPGVVTLVVPSAVEHEFANAGGSEIESALALERLAEAGRRERIVSGIANVAAGIASLLYPFEYFTPYDYVYSAVASFGMAVVDFLFPSKEELAFRRYEALERRASIEAEAANPFEARIEIALWEYEVQGRLRTALDEYGSVEVDLLEAMEREEIPEGEGLSTLSYCLVRQANVLRRLGEEGEALELGVRSIDVARESGDQLAQARAALSHGTALVMLRDPDGERLLEEALALFSGGQSGDHRQGVGWYWILVGDLNNSGYLAASADNALDAAERALDVLVPIGNWTGVARAYEAMARAYRTLGEREEADRAREAQREAEARAEAE